MDEIFFTLFPAWLKEERIRLGLTQTDAASLCGVRREAWGQYERGAVAPGSHVLLSFVANGADAAYLLTGRRTDSLLHLNDRERLRLAVEAVEEGLAATRRKLQPDKKAEIILAAYDLMTDPESNKGKVVQMIKLVA